MSLPVNYFSCKRTLKELLHLDDNDNPGYVEGRVFMVWPPRQKMCRILLEVSQDSTVYRFPVEVPYKDGLLFRPQDRILLSLKGVEVNVREESSASFSFPIALRYPHSVVLKYISGINAGRLIDIRNGMCVLGL